MWMIRTQSWIGTAAACALAFVSPAPALAGTAAAPAPRPALWKVADEDTTIWLFGTIHILPEPVDWYAGPVATALDGATELVTEIPIDGADAGQSLIVEKGLRRDGRELRQTLGARQRVAYDAGMRSIGLPPEVFDRNDAWFAGLMLTLIPLKMAGYNLETGIDSQVADRARARNLPNVALETPEFQISMFESLPEKTQVRYLGEVVDALPRVKAEIDAMVAAWKLGQADRLAALLNDQEDDPALRKVMLDDRNRNWARWLKARLATPGSVFVAVGAGHLAGKGSVQDQLARLGVPSSRVQ